MSCRRSQRRLVTAIRASIFLVATMTIANAVEMGYLPAGTGTVVRFQAIDTLQGGGWTNVGPTNISTGNWMYHLESIRDLDNRFFRAVENDNL